MARLLSVPVADNEDIISYECNFPSKIVRVLVGVGTIENGRFVPVPEQIYRSYIISDSDFDTLLAANIDKPANVFRPIDLWPFIDAKVSEEINKKGK